MKERKRTKEGKKIIKTKKKKKNLLSIYRKRRPRESERKKAYIMAFL